MLPLGVELGPVPVAQRLLGVDLRPDTEDAVLIGPSELIGELHEGLVGEHLRLVEHAPLVARSLIGAELGLETKEMGLEEEVAVGVFAPEEGVEVVGVDPLPLEEVGVGLGHDAVVGQLPAWIVDADVVVGLEGPAAGVEDRPGTVEGVGNDRQVVVLVIEGDPILRDDELTLGDPIEVARVGILFHDLVVGILRLRVLVGEEPALGELPHRLLLDRGVGPAVDRHLVFGARLSELPLVVEAVGLCQRPPCHRLVRPAPHQPLPAALDVVPLEPIPARIGRGGVFRRDDLAFGILAELTGDLPPRLVATFRPGPVR